MSLFSQQMTTTELDKIFRSVTDSIEGENARWQFKINEVLFISIADSTHNRMRIISPIIESSRIDDKLLEASLVANFHTALDVKYAISDGVLWSVFIHPLRELNEDQVQDAISQVYFANVNFGTTFASTSLVFPGSQKEDVDEENEKEFEKRKF
jgi:hypothetical protein